MFRKKIYDFRRKMFEAIGSDLYSRPSLHNIDRQLEKYLTQRDGFFIEVGGNDGFSQSNTYYLERFRGWTGILVEGIPELYQKCILERPQSKVFNNALVADDYTEPYITMKYANLMSIVKGALKSDSADENHIQTGKAIQHNVVPYEIKVPARTLTSILDECKVEKIDFLSLDVEGFELNVLKGLDFNKYRPEYMLIEARFKEEIDEYIADLYVEVDRLSIHDFLYQAKHI
jgi:FkbM family methyltransferase